MNNIESGQGFELPAVPTEVGASENFSNESIPVKPERYNQPSQQQPTAVTTHSHATQHAQVAIGSNSPSDDSSKVSQSMPLIADDNDLIEKEWVMKAKQIVLATKDDPYRQNIEISKMKADYLKKRYNKDIKVDGA